MKTLLIVDDEIQICKVLSRFFDLRGFRTQTAFSGEEAVEKLRAQIPDYLLLDVRMPGLSGFDVLKLAKQLYPDLKVVMVTAFGDEETVKTAFELGASDFITKPFSLDDQAWARAFFAAD